MQFARHFFSTCCERESDSALREMSVRRWGGQRGFASFVCTRCSRLPAFCPRLRRQDRRPVPRLAAERSLARGQGQRHFQTDFRCRLRRHKTQPEAARPCPARREAEDAAEAASGRVRLARRLFRREDGSCGDIRRTRTRSHQRQDAGRNRKTLWRARRDRFWRSGAARPASARRRCPTTPSRCSAPRRSCRPRRISSAPSCWPRWKSSSADWRRSAR